MNFNIVSPILGFDSLKEVEFSQVDDFFYALEKEGISFTMIDPNMLREYDIEIPQSYKNLLQIEDGDEVGVYNLVIIQNPIENSFINFVAPIILNKSKKLLVQVALDSTSYPEFEVSQSISDFL